ncbi:MAG: diguanylate cyclase, partial [Cyanobacteria bacterium J06648_11]
MTTTSRQDMAATIRENEELRREVERLQQMNRDLAIVLETTTEHADLAVSSAPASLYDDVRDLRREVSDLKIVLDTATAHADMVEAELFEKHAEISRLNDRLTLANQELQALANSDGLTGVANRRRFDESISREWRRQSRHSGVLSLILLDIDDFKRYNDTYGHMAGDDCLRLVATALKRTVDRPADLVARYGGEEFALLLPETGLAGASRVAEKVRAEIDQLKLPHAASRTRTVVTASLGVAA